MLLARPDRPWFPGARVRIVMAARATGFALLCSRSVQETMDFALIAQAATLEARIPFLHFFDGFRTSREIRKIEELTFEDMRAMIDDALVIAHRARGLSPDRPAIRGTAQNPDVHFQGRESMNPWYQAAPGMVTRAMERFAGLTGRRYKDPAPAEELMRRAEAALHLDLLEQPARSGFFRNRFNSPRGGATPRSRATDLAPATPSRSLISMKTFFT
ncbi:MAG TPA: hypothetical protein VN317_05650 [Candidatus Methanoperedens sp.]|nr:hypothetical protein [Candidatus Methanoperedens sp.]